MCNLMDALLFFRHQRVTEVLCGGARGPDTFGREWAEALEIPVRIFNPDWDRHGRSAGPLRNQVMVDHADALFAVWNGKSRGTADVIRRAKEKGLPFYVQRVDVQGIDGIVPAEVRLRPDSITGRVAGELP